MVPALLVTAGLTLWPTGIAAAQPAPTCNGLAATQVGTNGNDVLFGTNGPDVFVTLGGDDVVFGLNGNDTACLGTGADEFFGGAGNDTLTDPSGLDVGDGGAGQADRCDSRFESLSNCEIIF